MSYVTQTLLGLTREDQNINDEHQYVHHGATLIRVQHMQLSYSNFFTAHFH